MNISEAFAYYRKAEIMARGLSRKTDESYVYSCKLAVDFFGDMPITNIRPEDTRDYYEHLLGWQRPDTARGHMVCLRSVIKCLRRRDPNIMDPEEIRLPKREKREVVYLTKAEVEEFINVVARKRRGYPEVNRLRNVAIMELLYATGLRVGELCRLNKNSIKNHQFTVIGKSKEPRICFINSRAEEAINKYLNKRTDSSMAMFISNQTERRITPGTVRRIFQRACDMSDFEGVHPHTLRHSFATYMLEREVDLIYISQMMGHQSLDTTRMYTHYSNPKLKRIYDCAMEE